MKTEPKRLCYEFSCAFSSISRACLGPFFTLQKSQYLKGDTTKVVIS